MIGDLFEMETACGPVFLHHVRKDETFGDVVAVYRREERPATLEELSAETFALLFPIGTAQRSGTCWKVGSAKVPPKFERDRLRYPFHHPDGRFLYWVLVENGQERRGINKLTSDQLGYPIAVAVNEAALRDLVCAGYDAKTIQFR